MYKVVKGQVGKHKVGDVVPDLDPAHAEKLIAKGFLVDIGDEAEPAEVSSTAPLGDSTVPPVEPSGKSQPTDEETEPDSVEKVAPEQPAPLSPQPPPAPKKKAGKKAEGK